MIATRLGKGFENEDFWEAVLHRCDATSIELESVIVNMELESLFDISGQ